jgi:hypothetical protein
MEADDVLCGSGEACDDKLPRPAKADGFEAGLEGPAPPKLKPPNASSSPPILDFCCAGAPDTIPPKDCWEVCVGCDCGCGRGALAYNDRIDCFKSGRD